MIRKIHVLFFLCLFVSKICAQDQVLNEATGANNGGTKSYLAKDFPAGVYRTYEDFIEKNAINMGDGIIRKTVMGYKTLDRTFLADQVFFAWTRTDVKITDFFAISYNGSLYIQQRYFHKFSVKEDKNQDGDNPNSYHRVVNDGKFLYLEGLFANSWSKAFAYGSGGAVGGTIGANLNRLKGVVFDVEKKETNFIRNCEDLNLLIEKYNGNKIECKEKDVDILTVRENIQKIIK
ncbi:hypothetical protein [Flavobacterium sharifuzzamanii]|uniref:hypothetical protein n=1 Tax=Flavobacterium sharifuzzamanii TaxID=2211133 RepID=UPI000DAB639E|nr:hypothetical protein [Flavobacterium sharifuzzamanii]KAF2082154.1 hypothetical protein DMA14_04100 [Flavobacterium sharifuzzamanii]